MVAKRGTTASTAATVIAFDAGRVGRRLRSVPTSQVAINAQIRRYGKTVLARSRYLASNNPHAASAKETFVSALVGCGIKPSSLSTDPAIKKELELAWYDWTDEADADWLTDFYGLQSVVAAEMFEAGECFIRFRSRFPQDGLSVPLQLQLLPAEMLDISYNVILPNGRRIECGIEFDAIGRRVAYHFWRQHPDTDVIFNAVSGLRTVVPADEVLHLYKPMRAGQIRGIPHTLASIVTLAILDQYEDAELERKRIAALFGAFVTRPVPEDPSHPLGDAAQVGDKPALALEPGATIDLEPGEDVKFAEPADVGGNYEAFLYRQLLKAAAGFGVPYAAMTGDLRQTSYGSIRAGLIEFRRRIEAMQHSVMVYQFCRPIWQRWISDAVLSGAVQISPSAFQSKKRDIVRAKWMTPRWEWIDPLKDLQAEKLAVDNGFKSRDDVVEASGYDPTENDNRIAAGRDRAEALDLEFGNPIPAAAPIAAAPNAPSAQQQEQDDGAEDPVPPPNSDPTQD
jgi:lambda family phage portal protein